MSLRASTIVVTLAFLAACDRGLSRWDRVHPHVPADASATGPGNGEPGGGAGGDPGGDVSGSPGGSTGGTTAGSPGGSPSGTTDGTPGGSPGGSPAGSPGGDTGGTTPPPLPSVSIGADAVAGATLTRGATFGGSVPAGSTFTWDQGAGPGTLTFTDPHAQTTDLSADVDGTYTVRFTLTAGDGRQATATFALLWDTTAPSAPTGLLTLSGGVDRAHANTTNLTLGWTAATDAGSGVSGYRVQWHDAATCGGSPIQETDVVGTSLAVSGLADGTTYSFRVIARDALGHATASACSHGVAIDTTPPPAPAGSFTVTAAGQNVGRARWDLDATGLDPDVARIDVLRVAGSSAPADCASGQVAKRYLGGTLPTGAVSFVDDTYAAGATVSYRACVYDAADNATSWATVANVTVKKHILFNSAPASGNWGGLAGADAACKAEALTSSLLATKSETAWKAILSDAGIAAKTRVAVTGPVASPDLADEIASSRAALWGGALSNIPSYDSNNGIPGTFAWTGSSATGAATANTCGNWQSTAGQGQAGDPNTLDGHWLDDGTLACNTSQSLYCLSQSPDPVLGSFTAATAAGVAGGIALSVQLRGPPLAFKDLVITRAADPTVPGPACDDGSEILRAASYMPQGWTHQDLTGTNGATYQYRACVFDTAGNVLGSATASATAGP